jgi:hypothetical protein
MTMTLSFSGTTTGFGKGRTVTLAAAILASAVAVAAAIEGFATGAPAQGAPAGNATAGVFTGRYANGVPVYLLPPVSVVAIRKTEIAKMEREEQRAHASYGRADDAAHRTN